MILPSIPVLFCAFSRDSNDCGDEEHKCCKKTQSFETSFPKFWLPVLHHHDPYDESSESSSEVCQERDRVVIVVVLADDADHHVHSAQQEHHHQTAGPNRLG